MDFEKLKSFRNINNNFTKLLGIELTELSRLPSKYYESSNVLNFQ